MTNAALSSRTNLVQDQPDPSSLFHGHPATPSQLSKRRPLPPLALSHNSDRAQPSGVVVDPKSRLEQSLPVTQFKSSTKLGSDGSDGIQLTADEIIANRQRAIKVRYDFRICILVWSRKKNYTFPTY